MLKNKTKWFRWIVLVVLVGGMMPWAAAQGKKGGGGSKTEGTPLDAVFSDRLGDRITSDGQGVYSDRDGTLEVFVHHRSGNLMLHTGDGLRRVFMNLDDLDLTDWVSPSSLEVEAFLQNRENHRNGGVSGENCDQDTGAMQGGDMTFCKMRTHVAVDSDGIKYALQWENATVQCTTLTGPCGTWVVDATWARLIRWGGKGKNSVGTLTDPEIILAFLSMPFELTYTLQ